MLRPCCHSSLVGTAVTAILLGIALTAAGCEQQMATAPQNEAAPVAAPARTPNDWLFNLEGEDARLGQLQLQLRGADVAMWEIGERYEGLHEALSRGNFQLAVYHWDKIKQSLDNALVRRPARRASAESTFLDEVWPQLREVFLSGGAEQAWAGFERARTACMACHEAENLAYMNDMPLFALRAPGG
jgi:hypothetical protein